MWSVATLFVSSICFVPASVCEQIRHIQYGGRIDVTGQGGFYVRDVCAKLDFKKKKCHHKPQDLTKFMAFLQSEK